MENNKEQVEKRGNVMDERILEKVNGGQVIQQEDGTFYCTRCEKTVSSDHACWKSKVIVIDR